MSEIVERVARAIYHSKPRKKPWETLPIEFQRQYHKRARAALEAVAFARALDVSVEVQGDER